MRDRLGPSFLGAALAAVCFAAPLGLAQVAPPEDPPPPAEIVPDDGCGGEGNGCWPVCGCGSGCGCAAATREAGSATPTDAEDFPSSNVVLASRISLAQFGAAHATNFVSGSDCWGYVSPSGREYAIMGLNAGYSFVDVTDPRDPIIRGFITKPDSLWGDIAINGQYAYLVSDQTGVGIKIANLSNIDNGVVTLAATVTPSGLRTVHSALVHNGILYVAGANLPSNGLVALSLANPLSPTVIGQYSGTYCHDFQMHTYTAGAYAGKTVAFACMGSAGLDIVDYTNPANPTRIVRITYPNLGYCHQAWLEPSTNMLYMNDELDERNNPNVTACLTRVFDVSELEVPKFVGEFHIPNNVIDHNNYIRDGFLYQANYRAGMHIFDVRGPNTANPPRIGWFDSFPGADAREFNGAWNVYPYLPSGSVLVSDIEGGLFVLDPAFALNGGTPLAYSLPFGAPTSINPLGHTVLVSIDGQNGGTLDPSHTPTLVYRIDGGAWVETPLESRGGNLFAGRLPPTACLATVDYYFKAFTTGDAEVREPLSAPYVAYHADAAGVETTAVDDTLETNTGWTVGAPGDAATAGIWVRANPVGTGAQPEDDHTPDPGVNAYITGNGVPGGFPGEQDVDGGATTLTSPTFNASIGASGGDAFLSYWRWYSNDQGSFPNQAADSMPVSISNNNGASWTLIEDVLQNAGVWVGKSWRIADFIAPTSTMKIRFVARDLSNGSIVEAGLDDVRVYVRKCLLPGDVNADGFVNFGDLNGVLAAYGQTGVPGLPGDANSDGIVNFFDLNLVLGNFGSAG